MPNDRELDHLLALGDRIVADATKGGADVAECIVRSGAELSAKCAPRQARARRRGRHELGRAPGHQGRPRRQHLHERSLRRGPPSASWPTRSSSPTSASEDEFAGPADPSELCDPKRRPRPRPLRSRGRLVDAKTAIDFATRRREGRARGRPPHHQQRRGSFSRVAGGSAIVLSSGFRGSLQGLVPEPQRRAPRRGRGRQEAPRLPLDREAPPRRARHPRVRRQGGRAPHPP
jgi:PmbA protein